ncbi:MAG TPA: DNA recombination protein RmuC [Spirochaetia bacterium]|nr:DNA recombination protein RmuC [Spirochaetia bacterium]
MTIQVFLTAVAAAVFLLILLLAVLLSGRRRLGGAGEVALFENINPRLDQLEGLSKGIEDLSRLFLIPHTRGGIGESLLEDLLKNWLPRKSFETQYSFKNGARVDAVVKIKPYVIPIDAKFPLESVRRSLSDTQSGNPLPTDVRQAFMRHVEDIATKYIQPDEGTLQFALMYIPSERVYYQVFADSDGSLTETSLRRGVVPVSPSTLFLYLQTIAYGLRGFSFPEERREIIRVIQQLKGDLTQFSRGYSLAGTHLRNLQKAFDDSAARLSRVELLVERLEAPGGSDEVNGK